MLILITHTQYTAQTHTAHTHTHIKQISEGDTRRERAEEKKKKKEREDRRMKMSSQISERGRHTNYEREIHTR